MIKRSDAINFFSQAAIKGISIPYALIITGFLVREFAETQDRLVLAAQNYTYLTSLAQLGLGGFLLRRISHQWASTRRLEGGPDVRGAFWLSSGLCVTMGLAITALVATGRAPIEILPLLILSLVGTSLTVGDNVRLATGGVAAFNLIQLACYAGGGVMVFALYKLDALTPANGLVAAFGPPFVATLASFALLLRDASFRAMLAPKGTMAVWEPLRSAFPILMISVGFAGILSAPLAQHLIPAFPTISIAGLSCLRLFSSALNVFFFVLQPLIPIILRERYSGSFRRFALASGAIIGGLIIVCLVSGGIFAAASGPFIDIWLGGVHAPPDITLRWGVIAALVMALTVLVFFCQATSRPLLGAVSLLTAGVVTLAAGVLPGASVEDAMMTGMTAGIVVAAASTISAIRDARLPGDSPDRAVSQ